MRKKSRPRKKKRVPGLPGDAIDLRDRAASRAAPAATPKASPIPPELIDQFKRIHDEAVAERLAMTARQHERDEQGKALAAAERERIRERNLRREQLRAFFGHLEDLYLARLTESERP